MTRIKAKITPNLNTTFAQEIDSMLKFFYDIIRS